ncbi:MAG: hypothetical protein WC969_01070 [Elusimicrobiota bacterium]|jgi:hypothetical protein
MKNILSLLALLTLSAATAWAEGDFDPVLDFAAIREGARQLPGIPAGVVGAESAGATAAVQPDLNGPGVGSYSDGYRMGVLSKFSVKGMFKKSGEGELLLGQDSSVAYDGTGDDRKMINPWAFSSDESQAPDIQKYRGQFVVVKYHQVQIPDFTQRETDYNLVEIAPVDTTAKPKTACESDVKGRDSEGFRVARIVKASYKGLNKKSYEIMLQVGGSGNEFQEMSVSSEEMYQCALSWLKSGGKATVWYRESFFFNPLERNTGYDIAKIEPMPSLD